MVFMVECPGLPGFRMSRSAISNPFHLMAYCEGTQIIKGRPQPYPTIDKAPYAANAGCASHPQLALLVKDLPPNSCSTPQWLKMASLDSSYKEMWTWAGMTALSSDLNLSHGSAYFYNLTAESLGTPLWPLLVVCTSSWNMATLGLVKQSHIGNRHITGTSSVNLLDTL